MTTLPKPHCAYLRLLVTCMLLCGFSVSADAALTNLVIGNFDFEDTLINGSVATPGIVDDIPFEAEYPQWSTAGNSFQITAQGDDSAPTTFSDGTATGQSLQIRGNANNGQITLRVDIPNDPNILPGADAELRFQAWTLDNGSGDYDDTGTVRIRVNNVAVGGFNPASVGTDDSGATWELNTFAFTVSAGDSVDFQFRDSGPFNNDFGLRIDQVQLLVDIIPEPSHAATLILGVLMLFSYWRRRIPEFATRS
ncbi:MAG: hypothetical protein AAF571_11845 [Verrucomicrobiota bacterium]